MQNLHAEESTNIAASPVVHQSGMLRYRMQNDGWGLG
jgi:hypothetical protein